MGYYIELKKSNFKIPHENLRKAYKAMCELNTKNHLKTGGSWPRTPEDEAQIKAGIPNEKIHFAWMDWNYPETCKNAVEIFESLGFEVEEDDEGVSLVGYDNKSGAEKYFIEACYPFVESGSFLQFNGEDGAIIKYVAP